jgi:hypothetical protein
MNKRFLGFDTDKSWDYENGFYLTSQITRLAKALAQYELYKTIVGLPGHVVECGVYKGASFIRWASFREILENPYSRKIIGFDAFGKFPEGQEDAANRAFIQRFSSQGGDGIKRDSFAQVLAYKGVENTELIEGDIYSTVPQYVAKHPELKIALLHLDVDVYGPSKVVLDHLFERIVKGGLLIMDDYGIVPGETQAVDELIKKSEARLLIEKLPIAHIPAYIRK